jgi:hypothetical protein
VCTLPVQAQLDPFPRNLLQLGYDLPIEGQGPQALYAYYYYSDPDFLNSNTTFRMAAAPVYLDSEFGLRNLLSPTTDLGIGLAGGVFGDNHYEVRQGDFLREESFFGHGGGASLSLYQRLNPERLVPLNFILRGGARYLTYMRSQDTADGFVLPRNRMDYRTRVGLRFGGREPRLHPDLAMELSIWYEHHWRSASDTFGFGDRQVNDQTDLYWLFAGVNYAWTNNGPYKVEVSLTTGGSQQPDRFSAWRLGGVLPLVAEYPVILPGYYYLELSADHFAQLLAHYAFPLGSLQQWQIRVGGAAAYVDYLPGFEQPDPWHGGIGAGVLFTSRNRAWRAILRYGYGVGTLREDRRGAHSIGLLVQHDFNVKKRR